MFSFTMNINTIIYCLISTFRFTLGDLTTTQTAIDPVKEDEDVRNRSSTLLTGRSYFRAHIRHR